MNTLVSDQPSAFKYALKCGVGMGLFGMAFNVVLYLTNELANYPILWGFFLLMGVVDFFLVKNYRNKLPGNKISFGKAFIICFQIVLYGGIVYAVYDFVFMKYISPESLENFLKQLEQQLINKGMSQERIDVQVKMTRMWRSNGALQIGSSLVFSSFVGIIIALIVAALCKREPDVFADEAEVI
jgi:hypothetical protein